MDNRQYWEERAVTYNNLEWVRNKPALQFLLDMVYFHKDDVVLDIGTGTGAIASLISNQVKKVIGVDVSGGMLREATKADNIYYIEWDIRNPLFCSNIFTKVTARQILHHIPPASLLQVMSQCRDSLQDTGKFIIIEPICPSDEIREDYARIFAMKDGRNVFTGLDLIQLLMSAGFNSSKLLPFTIDNFSVRNWLTNNALSQDVQDKIFELHVTGSEAFKKAYNMKIVNGDCLISTHNVIAIGVK